MKLESKVKDFFNGQLSDAEEQKMMDQVYNYEFKQLLKQELARHAANAATDMDDATEPTAPIPQAEPIVSIPQEQAEPKLLTLHPSKRRIGYKIALGIAASVLLMIVVVGPFGSNPKETDATALIQSYLQNPPPRNITAGGGVSSEVTRLKANTYYDDGNYQAAAEAFQQLIDEGSNAKEDFFYGGLSFLSIKNSTTHYGKAVNYLLKARNLSQGWKSDDIHFYLAIAYFKNNQWKEAKALFEQIAHHAGTHQGAAKRILNAFPNVAF